MMRARKSVTEPSLARWAIWDGGAEAGGSDPDDF
jgi:hypothetical protein